MQLSFDVVLHLMFIIEMELGQNSKFISAVSLRFGELD